MTSPASFSIRDTDLEAIAAAEGGVAVFVDGDGKLDPAGRRANRLTRGALDRMLADKAFAKMKSGDVKALAYPTGMAADRLIVVRLDKRPSVEEARKAGVALAKAGGGKPLLIAAGNRVRIEEVILGVVLRGYDFTDHKSKSEDEDGSEGPGEITVMATKPAALRDATADVAAMAEGVFFARDLINAPSNVLTTTSFANELVALSELGLAVRVMEEPELEELGMRALLGVGQGSESPSKVVVMEWKGGGDEKPFALIGKGVVFDTGGISLKPAAGMEDMTMDMGGAGTVAGAMKTIALRKAKANVVGIVGLVENMPDGRAQRPGDVVKSMKGDTIEVINTDAEGRLVLCDVIWYAQETFEPVGMVDLATLTGAIIIGLGHEKAGVFSNDDTLCDAFLKAADAEGEGAWRMPLADAYDKLLKSRIADMKNVGGRGAGAITAAQFLQRFVKKETPWIHLDIAGVASLKTDGPTSPKGASGWGVLALNRLIRDGYEAG